MNTLICVNCGNRKPVNSTNNRLVTERCGHVKCMDCLLQEKTGCLACLQMRNEPELNDVPSAEECESVVQETLVQSQVETIKETTGKTLKNYGTYEYMTINKTKLETSHIRVETGMN